MNFYRATAAVLFVCSSTLIAGCYGSERTAIHPTSSPAPAKDTAEEPAAGPAEAPSADEKPSLVLSEEFLKGQWSVTSYQITDGGVSSELLDPSKPIALVFGGDGWVRLDYLNPIKPSSTPQKNYDIVDGKLNLMGLEGFDSVWDISLTEGEMTITSDDGQGTVTRVSLKKVDGASPLSLADLKGDWRVESVSLRAVITTPPNVTQEQHETFTPKVELHIAEEGNMTVHRCVDLKPYEGGFTFNSNKIAENAYYQNGEIKYWDLSVSGDTMIWKNRNEIPQGILETTIAWKKGSAPLCEPSDVIVYQ